MMNNFQLQIDAIQEKSKNAGSIIQAMQNCQAELNELNKAYGEIFTTKQLFYLLLLVHYSLLESKIAPVKSFTAHIGCKPIEVLDSIDCLNEFFKKGLVERLCEFNSRRRKRGLHDSRFFLTEQQLNKIFKGELILNKNDLKVLTAKVFMQNVKYYFDLKYESEINLNELMLMLYDMLIANKELDIVVDLLKLIALNQNDPKRVIDLEADDAEQYKHEIVFIMSLMVMAEDGEINVRIQEQLEKVFDESIGSGIKMMRYFTHYKHILFKDKYLQCGKNTFKSKDEFYYFTKKFYKHFGIELQDTLDLDEGIELIVKPAKIKVKPLFFNKNLEQQLGNIKSLLDEKTYKKSVQILKDKYKGPGGICMLLHGDPGTGKTEFVYQVAKETNRPIYKVDISDLKSMWYGQSEKRIKEEFNFYHNQAKNCRRKPIMFFNEADALFGKRLTINSSVDQTNNTIQNILLEELENFTGILICTTNLIENLDAAFERRFLMKVKMEKPNTELQTKIWQYNYESLHETEAKKLAGSFDFSPAQIQNVVQKAALEELLGNTVNYDLLANIALAETYQKRNFIGYN